MNPKLDEEIKRWTVRRKSALVMDIIQGRTTVREASDAFELPAQEIERWVEEGRRGMENALRSNPLNIKEIYEKQIKTLQQAYGEAMLELRVKSKQGCPSSDEEK